MSSHKIHCKAIWQKKIIQKHVTEDSPNLERLTAVTAFRKS